MKNRNNYKQKFTENGMLNWGKKGQLAVYVIVAVVIVALIVLGVMFYPKIQSAFGVELNPQDYLTKCVEPIISDNVALLANQSGYAMPEGFVVYDGQKVKYLCYVSDSYKTCKVQQPMIKNNFENELNKLVAVRAVQCVSDLKAEYEKRGYSVSLGQVSSRVEIVPDKIKINFKAPMTITKDTSQTFKEFNVEEKSGIYDLLFIAQSIVDFESAYGDSETTLYMQYYPNLKIEKIRLEDGTKIYRLSDVISKESFEFASRSLVFPPGEIYNTQ